MKIFVKLYKLLNWLKKYKFSIKKKKYNIK